MDTKQKNSRAVVLDGARIAQEIKAEIQAQVVARESRGLRPPSLAILLVGKDAASQIYVKHKQRDCTDVGITNRLIQFSSKDQEAKVLEAIEEVNKDSQTDGIIVQLPLPAHISKDKVIACMAPHKDVDGFHHLNFGRLGTGLPAHVPATPNGILELLRRYKLETRGLHAVIVGRSHLVGLPMSILLARGNNPGDATVTLAHRHTQNLSFHTRQADLLISAVGKPGLIGAKDVKEGAIVIDVGITRVEDASHPRGWRLCGDVDYGSVKDKASYITPVPRGVGPMTRAALLMNTLRAVELSTCA